MCVHTTQQLIFCHNNFRMATMGDAQTCNSKLNVCLRIKPTKEKNDVSWI